MKYKVRKLDTKGKLYVNTILLARQPKFTSDKEGITFRGRNFVYIQLSKIMNVMIRLIENIVSRIKK